MPVIQTYTSQKGLQISAPRLTDAKDFGGDKGFGDLEKGINDLYAVQKQKDTITYNKQISELQLETMKRQQELSTQDIPDGADYQKIAVKDFEDRIKSFKPPSTLKDQWLQDQEKIKFSIGQDAIKTIASRQAEKAQRDWTDTVTAQANIAMLNPAMQKQAILTLQETAKSLPLDPEQRATLVDNATEKVRTSVAATMADKNPGTFLAQAKSGQWNDLSNLQTVMNTAEASIKRENSQKSEGYQLFKAETNYNLAQAETPEQFAQIENAIEEKRSSIGDTNYFTLKTAVLKASEKKLADFESVQKGEAFASGEEPLNPNVQEDVAAIDNYYTKVLKPTVEDMPYPVRNERLSTVINNTKVVPNTLAGEIESVAYGTDIEAMDETADLLTRLEQKNPMLLNRFHAKDMAVINMVKTMRESGYDNASIKERLTELRKPLTKSLAEGREAEAAKITPQTDDVLNDVYDSVFKYQPQVYDNQKAEMQNVINESFKSHFVLTGDETLAEDHARLMVKQQFGETKVNGRNEVMRYAPESYYSIEDVDNDWIREQAIEDIQSITENGIQPYGDVGDRMFIIPDPFVTPKTAAQGEPVYNIMIKGEDGVLRSVLGQGQYWKPDRSKKIKTLKGK